MTALTPPQTIGPFFAYCLTSSDYGQKLITSNRVQAGNERQVLIKGSIYDGNGAPVTDAMLEIWQIDAQHISLTYISKAHLKQYSFDGTKVFLSIIRKINEYFSKTFR